MGSYSSINGLRGRSDRGHQSFDPCSHHRCHRYHHSLEHHLITHPAHTFAFSLQGAVPETRVPLAVIKLLLTAFALGLASLDVTGALAAVGALGAGARVRALVAFGCFSILGTVAFGTALSLIVGPRIVGLDWGMLLPHDPTEDRVAASVNVVVGLGLLTWGLIRTRRPATRSPKPSAPRGLGLISLAGAGMLFALAAIFDPRFVSLVVIAGRAELFWSSSLPTQRGRWSAIPRWSSCSRLR
jgi:hypothetical protein